MKFLFIAPRYHTNMHFMVKSLVDHDDVVSMLSLYQGKSENYSLFEPKVLGYSKFFVLINKLFNSKKGGNLIKNPFEIKYSFPPVFKLLYEIKKSKSDVVVVKNIHSTLSFLSLLFSKFLRKKVIVLFQVDKYRAKPKSNLVSLVWILFRAPVITPILGDTKYENLNNNLYYIPFPIECFDFEKKYLQNGKINIICVGKFQRRKAQLDLLKVVNKLKTEYNFHVTLIGEDDEQEYTSEMMAYIKNNLSDIVTIKQQISHEEVLKEYKQNDLFVLPSWQEAASFSVLEAMSSKLPVICSDDNGTKCYIDSGQNGYVFENKNVQSLEEAVRKIIKDKDNFKKMGDESFRIVKKDHNLEIFYNKFISLVK